MPSLDPHQTKTLFDLNPQHDAMNQSESQKKSARPENIKLRDIHYPCIKIPL